MGGGGATALLWIPYGIPNTRSSSLEQLEVTVISFRINYKLLHKNFDLSSINYELKMIQGTHFTIVFIIEAEKFLKEYLKFVINTKGQM